jgi:hypothetical protein
VYGCPYDDYGAPSRAARPMCLKTCTTNSDCRQSDGYVCAQLFQPPWDAGPPWTAILDSNRSRRVCVLAESSASVTIMNSDVCSSSRPVTPALDAMVTVEEAAPDVGDVASPDVGESATTADAGSDVQGDAAQDGVADAGVSDAPDGG